jgi:hypothetical protein
MSINKSLPLDESDNGKYIIVKIPRRTLQVSNSDPLTLLLDQRKYQRTLRMIGFIAAFIIGVVIGSIYHNYILTINSDHATWKMFTTATKEH